MSSYYYETTPYGVKQDGDGFVVEQMWWGKVLSRHATREDAESNCLEIARDQGYLRKVRVR